MGMPAREMVWTAEMARALPDDGKRYEVLDGELFVTPAPSGDHQFALKVLYDRLNPYVTAHGIGVLLWSPADIEFSPRRLVQPDLFVARLVDGKRPRGWRDIRGLALAIEAQSPTTAHADRHRKRRIYMEEAVDEYWIVDLDARLIERWRKGDTRPEVLDQRLEWQPRPDVAQWTLDIESYFAEVLDQT
jgi:Uma2 family endonuclease